MKVQPAKSFPYSEITGFCVNKYTDSVKFGDVYAFGTQKKEPSVLSPCSFSAELRKKRPRYRTSSGFLSNSSGFRLNVLVAVQRPPSHPSFLTANSSRRFSRNCKTGFPNPLCFISTVLLAPSNPEEAV